QYFTGVLRVSGTKPSAQTYKMSQCAKMLYPMRKYYDYVAFTRPDLLYLHPFNPDQLCHGFANARVRELGSNHRCGLNIRRLSEESVSFQYNRYNWFEQQDTDYDSHGKWGPPLDKTCAVV